jgi:hypothetical protein
MHPRTLQATTGAALAALASIGLAMALVPLRADIDNSVVVLLLVLPVLLAAVSGGALGGAATAVVATLSFDFFFTVPYHSLHVASAEDVETALALLVVAVLVGTIAAKARQATAEAEAGRADVESMHRVASLVARRADRNVVVERARVELEHLLSLEACEFVATPTDTRSLPEMAHSGRIDTHYLRYLDGGFELPVGSQLPTRGPRGDEGHFVLHGRPSTPVSLQRRLAAVVVADLVGARLGDPGTGPTDGEIDDDPDERGAAQ